MNGADDDIPEGGWSRDSDDNNADIQELLDLGYEQLDAFSNWVDTGLELGHALRNRTVSTPSSS